MAWAEPAAGPKTLPVFGHVQSQCTNIMSESRQQAAGARTRSRPLHSRQTLCTHCAGYPIPGTVKDAARVFWTRVCRLTMGMWRSQRGWGGVRVACRVLRGVGGALHVPRDRERGRDRDSDSLRFHIFADCIPRPTYSPCLSHSRGWGEGGEWASALPRAAGRLRAAPY